MHAGANRDSMALDCGSSRKEASAMAKDKLPSYHLTRDKKRGGWQLEKAGSDRARARFETKVEALKRGVLKAAVGNDGGSVKIHKQNGRIQQERTYPSIRDPKSSKG
jgi:hypothetical protein